MPAGSLVRNIDITHRRKRGGGRLDPGRSPAGRGGRRPSTWSLHGPGPVHVLRSGRTQSNIERAHIQLPGYGAIAAPVGPHPFGGADIRYWIDAIPEGDRRIRLGKKKLGGRWGATPVLPTYPSGSGLASQKCAASSMPASKPF